MGFLVENKRYLFLCSTQFTAFNCINVVLNDPKKYQGNTDIVLFHQTESTVKLAEKLKENSIFNTVYNFPFINNLNSIFLIILFLFPRFILHKLCLNKELVQFKKNQYNAIYSQSLLYAALFKLFNKHTKTFLIEEGLSSYTSRTLDVRRRSTFYRLVNRTFLRHFFLADIKGQLLYKPELYCGEKGSEAYIPISAPQYPSIFDKIFEYKSNDIYKSNKFVYLGAPYWGLRKLISNPDLAEKADKNLERMCKSLVDRSMTALTKSSFIYRVHPIEEINDKFYESFCILDKCKNMWEIECQNSLSNEHILMSFFSTASFTPKLLYGKEPYLIFLDNLTGYEFLNSADFIKGLKLLYRTPEKIMQPRSEDELFEIIKNLS